MERQRTKRQNGHKERLASQRDGQGKVTQGQTDRGTEKRVILREGGGEVETVAEIYCEGKLFKKPVYFILLGCVVSNKYFQCSLFFVFIHICTCGAPGYCPYSRLGPQWAVIIIGMVDNGLT